jgi:hypothetical protein
MDSLVSVVLSLPFPSPSRIVVLDVDRLEPHTPRMTQFRQVKYSQLFYVYHRSKVHEPFSIPSSPALEFRLQLFASPIVYLVHVPFEKENRHLDSWCSFVDDCCR